LIALALGGILPAWGADWSPAPEETWLKIDKGALRIYLMQGESDVLKSYPVAIGKGKGNVKKSRFDLITPEGIFKVWRVVQNARELVYDPSWFNEPGEPKKGVYGARLISFYNPWQIAIHGTDSPGSVGKRVTHGCVRLRNRDITQLSRFVKPGMRLVIAPGTPRAAGKASAKGTGAGGASPPAERDAI
jgi:lipoprotein-anchoring transpeptidase ErfK/SrfK